MKHADKLGVANRLRKKYANFESKIRKSLNRALPNPSEEMNINLMSVMGNQYARSQPFCSDLTARKKASGIFVGELLKMWGRTLERTARGKRPTYFAFATFIHKEWNCSDRDAAFNIDAMRNKVAKAIRDEGLNGIAVIEIQPLSNYPERLKGRSLMGNVHALVWSRQEIDRLGWQQKINSSPAWVTDFGCPALLCRELKPDTLENRHNITTVLEYMVKPPHDTKYLRPQPNDPSRFMFAPTKKGYAPNLALRIFECLSYLTVYQVVFGVGDEGKKWCNKWRARVRTWQTARWKGALLRDVDPTLFWAEYRRITETQKFAPFRLLKSSARGNGLAYRGGDDDPAQRERTTTISLTAPENRRLKKLRRKGRTSRRPKGSSRRH